MAQYLGSMASFSNGFYSVPGREYVCLSLAIVGFLCLAMAASALARLDQDPIEIRPEQD